MPDIAMCINDKCSMSVNCYRHKDSGTEPSKNNQAYMFYEPKVLTNNIFVCNGFLSIKKAQSTEQLILPFDNF
jgi:hypothetical protein